MSPMSFDDYKRECEQMLQDIKSYKNTDSKSSKEDTRALKALQQTCSDSRSHSLNTADILRNFKTEIETAQRVFKSVVGDTKYEYTEGPHAWHDGPEKTLIPGAKNEMLAFVDSKIYNCLFYIQCMIDIKSAEERAAASSTETTLDNTAQTKQLLHRLESYFTYL